MPPAKAKPQPTAEARAGGDRLDRRGPQARGDAERGRPRPGPRAAAEQRRVRQHDPRPDRRRPPADAGSSPSTRPTRPGSTTRPNRWRCRRPWSKKYLEAARRRRRPPRAEARRPGLRARTRCSPTPTATSIASRRIIDFYKRQKTDYADYFLAAWRYRHRAALGKPDAHAGRLRRRAGAQPQVPGDDLVDAHGAARGGRPDRRAPGDVGRAAGPRGGRADAARAGCERMRDFVVALRAQLVPEVKNLTARGISDGTQPFVLWKNRQLAANRMRYAGGAAKIRAADLGLEGAAARALAVPGRPGGASSGSRRRSTASAGPSPTPSTSRSGPASTSTRRRTRGTPAGCSAPGSTA